MSVLETLACRLNPQAGGWQVGSRTGPALQAGEVAAMLAGLPAGPVHLAYAVLTGGEADRIGLYRCLQNEVANWAAAERWDIDWTSGVLTRLALLVRDDLVLTRALLGRDASARALAVTVWQWRAHWQARHARLLALGMNWRGQVEQKLREEMRYV